MLRQTGVVPVVGQAVTPRLSRSVIAVRSPRGTGRGPVAGELWAFRAMGAAERVYQCRPGRWGRQAVFMVRRRSTVRFRKGALQFREIFRI